MPQASTRIRVPFPDVDSSGRIHFTAMLRYMEIAEHELMRSIGFPYATALLDTAFPRVHVECDFHGAVRFDDIITVEAHIERVGRSSWTVAFTARPMREDGTENGEQGEQHEIVEVVEIVGIVARGRITIVAMNPATERATALPEVLRRALSDG